MISTTYGVTIAALFAAAVVVSSPSFAQGVEPELSNNIVGMEEVMVTARRREERLQSVPDSISAFTTSSIVNSNIHTLGDVAKLTPSLNFKDGRAYSGGFFDLRMRGIGQGQQGWPSVAFIVDGVPTDSPDALTGGSLADVERIEVLRGPQSALYGAGAIAGAINIVTKRPADRLQVDGYTYMGNGNDLQLSGAVSGAMIPDKAAARLSVQYRDDDGRIDSRTNGLHLDPTNMRQVEGRVIFTPKEDLELDFRGFYNKWQVGFAFQERVPSVAYINDYDPSFDVARNAGNVGSQNRELWRLVGRLNWDLDQVTFTSITSFSHTRQQGMGSGCFDDVDNPRFPNPNGGETCMAAIVAFGAAAQTGQNIDVIQSAIDNYDTWYQDFRLSSRPESPIQWLIGVSGMHREALNAVGVERSIAGLLDHATVSLRAYDRLDKWWGVYGQVGRQWDEFELTLAGRYDSQQYESTTYTDPSKTVVVPVPDEDGNLIDTQVKKADNFQPKAQLSYYFDEQRMAYATVSRGFRAGYFNTGAYGVPEKTTNYELGMKSQWLDNRLLANLSVFHIDYSNQQLSAILLVPPFRVPVTVPKTRINGAELETAFSVLPALTLSGNVAYLDAKLANDTTSPKSPEWSGSVSAQLTQPLNYAWTLNGHLDWSFHSSQYLFLNNTQWVPQKSYLNLRVGLEREKWGVYLVGRNLTQTQEDEQAGGVNPVYFVRYPTQPRSYGIEFRADY